MTLQRLEKFPEVAHNPVEAVRFYLQEAKPIHPDTEALLRCRDGRLTEGQRRATERHLESCAECRLAYDRLCRQAHGPAAPAAQADPAILSGVLKDIDRFKAAQAPPEQHGEALKQRIASELEPFLGTGGTDRVLESVSSGGENLLSKVESVMSVFMGKRTAAMLTTGMVDHAILLRGSLRKTARQWSPPSFRDLARRLPTGWARLIVLATLCSVALGLGAFALFWRTGDAAWVDEFFRMPGALAAISMAAIELWFSLRVIRQFAPGEALRAAWILISSSAVCNLASGVFLEVLEARSQLNLAGDAWPGAAIGAWRNIALMIGGTYRFALLAAGLYYALKAYRQSGFLERLRFIDWTLLAIPGAYVLHNLARFTTAAELGSRPEIALHWMLEPLLLLLLWQTLSLYRSVQGMGQGWISRCWGSYTTGVFLTSIGDIALWAANHGYWPRPLISLMWYAWLPAAAAFALAPAYQAETIRFATRKETA